MTDSTQQSELPATRLDPAHDLMLAGRENDVAASWMAMAGRDPGTSADQVDRQTGELMGYVREQNDELDSRQAELNAKLAQLDNELRTARLKQADDGGSDLGPSSSLQDSGISMRDLLHTHPEGSELDLKEFEEVEHLVCDMNGSETTGVTGPHDTARVAMAEQADGASIKEAHPGEGWRDDTSPKSESVVSSGSVTVQDERLYRFDETLDVPALVASLDSAELESEKRFIAERKNELDRRQTTLQKMQQETQALHRESLELRLVTEQLWLELSEKDSEDNVNELLLSLRNRLDQQYAGQQADLVARRESIQRSISELEEQRRELRKQSKKLDEWLETQRAGLRSMAAELDAREALLDQREHRMHEERAKWEANRGAYQKQIQDLLKKLDLSSI